MRLSCYVVAGILTAWWLAVLLVTIFQCNPVQKAWSPYMTTGYCIDSIRFYKAMIIPNIITDIIIFCLPVYEVKKLHLPRGQRVGLASVFLLGAFAIVASAIRLWYNNKLAADGAADLTREYQLHYIVPVCVRSSYTSDADPPQWTCSIRFSGQRSNVAWALYPPVSLRCALCCWISRLHDCSKESVATSLLPEAEQGAGMRASKSHMGIRR